MMNSLANLLLEIISSTITFYWILIGFSLLFLVFKRKKIFIVLVILANSYLFIICFTPIPYLLVKNLESKYEPIDLTKIDTSKMYHIFVLGGGHTIASHLPANDQLEKGSLTRLIEGIRIYRLLPHSKIICSGQSTNSSISQAQLVAQTAIDLGVNRDSLLLFHTTSNTLDEARQYKDSLFSPNISVILVTDAIHMKRATECFEHFNIPTMADPTNHRVKFYRKNHTQNFTILLENFEFFNHAVHEYIGSLYMKTLKNE